MRDVGWRNSGPGKHFTTEGETSGYSLAFKEEKTTIFQQLIAGGRRRSDATILKATAEAPKRISLLDYPLEEVTPKQAYQKNTEALKPSASAVLGTRPTFGANKRKRTEPLSDISDMWEYS
ncbi:predicted protein [Sclerotinia sclerotiorum 1980 UF-70]|uniref:Uncharacterized protein n=2 Tax=Sclerotinia sclerotiorum (strain ATCC 18683 / 1980 / Ss-1) TaxID=665079 RepID=A7ELJ4_SCLS1|nr:predicted protein [Sclerotinia sclerotiorum 1980 UF-70]APA09643.1 hypothetical protein sscle_05g044130 [Sclerotinia sclerotiorum 1980 UF-70]EDO03710.1 predicted protein [Sclerotinia sclerotiorum 1980 UF-70]